MIIDHIAALNSEALKEFRQAAYDLLVKAKDATSLAKHAAFLMVITASISKGCNVSITAGKAGGLPKEQKSGLTKR